MASRPRPPSTSRHALLALTAALSLTFCILPASLAAATAQRDRGRAAPVTALRGAATAAPHAGLPPSSPAPCCAVGSPAPPVASHDGRRDHEGGGRGPASAPRGPVAGTRHKEGTGRPPASAPSEPAAQTGREEGAGSSACCAGHGGSTSAAADRGRGEAGAGRARNRGRGRPPEERQAPRATAPRATAPRAVAASSAPILAAVAAPAPVPAKAPAASTPQLIGGRVQSASPAVAASRRSRAAPTGARRPSRGALTRSPLAPAVALLAVPAAATGGPTARREIATAPSHPAASQIVTTVTRIINVIPAAVQIAIGVLVALALALAISSRLASLRARRLARQRRQLLEDVGLLQAALLPPVPARLGPVGTSSAYRPASGPGAGGDFYDVFALGDGQVAVIVGDVSGHGRSALPQTTLVRFTLRAYLEAGMSPRSALQMAAPVLERQLGESFATVVLATYHPRERTLVYACAGHPPPLVLGSESIAPITVCSSPPIGAGQPTGTRQTVVSLPGESLVCFYTDGVLDARVAGQLFGVRRLKLALAGLGPDATASALLDRVAEESDQRPDDMAACLLRVEGDRSAPSVQKEELELDGREAGRDRAGRLLLARGLDAGKVEHVISSARGAVARDGTVVIELHLGEMAPEVTLRPQNVTSFEPTIRARSRALEMSG
jgi:serine phosphatase RsbU (regulator of sigma subunit)